MWSIGHVTFLDQVLPFFGRIQWVIGLMSKVIANDPGDQGSISGRVIPKTQKMVLDAVLLNTQHYKVRIGVKWSNPGKAVVPSPTPPCNSDWKGSLWVTLDEGRQHYFYLHRLEKTCILSPLLQTAHACKLSYVDHFPT